VQPSKKNRVDPFIEKGKNPFDLPLDGIAYQKRDRRNRESKGGCCYEMK
jgi:hypothetical protein